MKYKKSSSAILLLLTACFLNMSGMEVQEENQARFDITRKICDLQVGIVVKHIIPFIPLREQTLLLRFMLKDIQKGEKNNGSKSIYKDYQSALASYLKGVDKERNDLGFELWELVDKRERFGGLFPEFEMVPIDSEFRKKKGAKFEAAQKLIDIHLKKVQKLINAGAKLDVLKKNPKEFELVSGRVTPLAIAVWYQNFDLIKLLSRAGADIDLCDREPHHSPIVSAVSRENPELVQLLCDMGAKNMFDSLELACHLARYQSAHYKESNLKTICSILIKHGADVGRAAFTAVEYSNLKIIQWFIQEKEDTVVAARHRLSRNSLLIEAAESGLNRKICKELLRTKIDINAQNRFGKTALMCAAENRNWDICRDLINAGADAALCDKKGKKAEDYAHEAWNNHQQSLSLKMEDKAMYNMYLDTVKLIQRAESNLHAETKKECVIQ